MRLRLILICVFLLIFQGLIFAQPPLPAPPRPSITTARRPGVFPIRAKQTGEQKRKLAPDARDLKLYERFLAEPRTGIFRLMPDLGCHDNMNVVRADETCLKAIPESAFYSFREREHTLESLADIRLKNGFLISDGILSQSILVNLGEIEIENVTLETEGLRFLRNYLPPVVSLEAQKHYFQMIGGVRIGTHEYRKALRAGENATYALRVVAYRGSIFRTFRGFRYDLLAGDKRIDLIIAFRIIRKEPDGTLTLVWKELERKESPKIKYPKRQNK